MADTTIIPAKINVGFQKRTGTYTGQLGYIIYYDHKGVLRKETSWQSWRDKTIPNQEFDNIPTEGFVLNKTAGGGRGWDSRRTVSRIYDPRGFEFEIGIDNLLYILENANCIRGKGLEGKFVYGWNGTDLVLIPENAPEYASRVEFSGNLAEKVSSKELVVGRTYLTNRNNQLVYMGRFDYYDHGVYSHLETGTNKGKHYFFMTLDGDHSVETFKSLSGKILKCVDEQVVPNFAEMMDILETDLSYSPRDPSKHTYVKVAKEDEAKLSDWWFRSRAKFFVEHDGRYMRVEIDPDYQKYRISSYYVQGYPWAEELPILNSIHPMPKTTYAPTHYSNFANIDTLINVFHLLIRKDHLANGKQKR